MLSGLTHGFGKQREVHEDAKGDGPLHGLAEWNGESAMQCHCTVRHAEARSVTGVPVLYGDMAGG